MLSFGEKMTEKELDEMVAEANCDKDGHIDYDGMYFLHISFRLRTQLPKGWFIKNQTHIYSYCIHPVSFCDKYFILAKSRHYENSKLVRQV